MAGGGVSRPVNANSFRTLEFEAVRTLLLGQAGSEVGRELIGELDPLTDPEAVREALASTSEGVALLDGLGRQPYQDLPPITELLSTARVRGSQLAPADLMDVASFVEGGGEIARAVARAEATPQARAARLGGRATSRRWPRPSAARSCRPGRWPTTPRPGWPTCADGSPACAPSSTR